MKPAAPGPTSTVRPTVCVSTARPPFAISVTEYSPCGTGPFGADSTSPHSGSR
ncbi:MAG: hypothetical protein ACRC33_11985 [Gemmataceae bacterium]